MKQVTFEGGPLDRQTLNVADDATSYIAAPPPPPKASAYRKSRPLSMKHVHLEEVKYNIVRRWVGCACHWVGVLA